MAELVFLVAYAAAAVLCGRTAEGAYDASGEYLFQEYLRWNYTYMNPDCNTPGGRNPCQDIRVCNFAAASIAIGGWPTLCGWVGKGVPKVCCGLPLVLGPALMKKVDEEISRKRECGKNTYTPNLSKTQNKFFEVVKNLPEIDTSDPNKFDPPLDLDFPSLTSSLVTSDSQQGEFPWMVSVRKGGEHVCGGSLLDKKHILTAAHCLDDESELYTVHVGNLYVDDGYPINVTKIRVHPGYDRERRVKDLALLTLVEEILTPTIPHICLPENDPTMLGRNSTLLRWSTVEQSGTTKQKLCITEALRIVPIANCLRIRNDLAEKELFGDYICTEGQRSRRVCEKGYGGPLMYQNTLDNPTSQSYAIPWSVVGVDTLGPVYTGARSYGLHTRVASFLDWIEKTLKEDIVSNAVRYD